MKKKWFNLDSKQLAPYLAGLLLEDHGGVLDLDPARLQLLNVWIINLHSFSNQNFVKQWPMSNWELIIINICSY
jgi:hypothetical protein